MPASSNPRTFRRKFPGSPKGRPNVDGEAAPRRLPREPAPTVSFLVDVPRTFLGRAISLSSMSMSGFAFVYITYATLYIKTMHEQARPMALGGAAGRVRYVAAMKRELVVNIWSDIACPGATSENAGSRRRSSAFPTATRSRSYGAPSSSIPRRRACAMRAYPTRSASRTSTACPRARQKMIDDMTNVAKGDGLDFHFERAQSGNTFDAHRVIHLARERGEQDAVRSASCAPT